jgi:phytol kinase
MSFSLRIPLLLAICFLLLFSLGEYLYHRKKVKAEITRKIIHIGTGLLTLLFPLLLHNHWQVLLLCGSFLILLLASLQFKLLPSINGIDRISHGSVLYPVAVYGTYLAYNQAHNGLIVFYLPILILAICDPLAALVGKRYPWGKYQLGGSKKTLAGSAAFFVATCAVTYACFGLIQVNFMKTESILPTILLIATTTTAVEAISAYGFDNVSIPATVILNLTIIT